MMRATGAKLRMLASEATLQLVFLGDECGGEVEERGDEDDMTAAQRLFFRYTRTLSGSRQW